MFPITIQVIKHETGITNTYYYDDIYQKKIYWEQNIILSSYIIEEEFPFTFFPSLRRIEEVVRAQGRYVIIDDILDTNYIIESIL